MQQETETTTAVGVDSPAIEHTEQTAELREVTVDDGGSPQVGAPATDATLDALVASSPPDGAGSTGSSSGQAVSEPPSLPQHLALTLELVLSQHGIPYLVIRSARNPYVEPLGSRKVRNLIRAEVQRYGRTPRKRDLDDLIDFLRAHAEMEGQQVDVWNRVAPIEGGIEIDLGDSTHARVRVTAGKIEIIEQGSNTLVFRPLVSQPMALPAEAGDLERLRKYLNVSAEDFRLIAGWLSYTLATPKTNDARFPILVVNGDQGSGKSSLSLLILRLIDPSHVGVQIFPSSAKDLAIAAANSHLLAFDNLRGFKAAMADILCIAATGGAMSTRALYTDADQHVRKLHVALLLNGVHAFIDQPDLAQRCVPVRTLTLPESERKSDTAMAAELREDLPVIMRGLLDLIAEILTHVPHTVVTNPERMLDFVRWLAAMEMADGTQSGNYQKIYSEALQQAQLDSLMENLLANAVIAFATEQAKPTWHGTPSKLLEALEFGLPRGSSYSRDWPSNAIALSKRLNALKASLATQGIEIEFDRGKERTITITNSNPAIEETSNVEF